MRFISKPKPGPVILPATKQMPPIVAKAINQAVNQNIAELIEEPDTQQQRNVVSSMIAGSGLRFRR